MRPDVALIAPYPGRGRRHAGRSGVAPYAAHLAHALRDAGASVTVIAPEEPRQPRLMVDAGVRVERSFRPGLVALPAAARAARSTGAATLHLQHEVFLYGGPGSVPGLVPGLRLMRGGTSGPVVTMHHVVDPRAVDADFTRLHRVRVPAALARQALTGIQGVIRRLACRVIVHEPSFARVIPGAVVVPHGIERVAPADRAAARRALGIEGGLTVLCFGFIAPYKGLENALRAAALAGEDVRLVVAGGEHPRLAGHDGYARELRSRWGAAARFVGYVPEPDVARWFAAADVALFPYPRPFSTSGALALALAHGTPPLVSPSLAASIGAPEELVAPTDPEPLARRLDELAARPELLEAVRKRSVELTRGRSWPEIARRHLELYEEVRDAESAAGRRLRAA